VSAANIDGFRKTTLSDVENGIALNHEAFYSKIATFPFRFSTQEHSMMTEPLQKMSKTH
jgi:hypothetical protein